MYQMENRRGSSFDASFRPSIHTRRANITVKFQDSYGFIVKGNVDDVNVWNEVRERVRQQSRVWCALEASKGANWYLQPQILSISQAIKLKFSLRFSIIVNAVSIKRLIRKGVPPNLRPKVWFSLSGAAKKKDMVPESYYSDLTKAVEGPVANIPWSPLVGYCGGHAALRRVLVGYSFRDSEVGYCQGLNYVAAILLLVMKTEEDAFWILAVLLEDVLVSDCYSHNLTGFQVEQHVFKDLLAKKSPRIATHLEDLEFDISLVATEWFLCLFSKSLPSETTMRVWDVLFFEGAQVLLHVALAIFLMKEDELLLAHHAGHEVKILQKTTHHLFDPEDLLSVKIRTHAHRVNNKVLSLVRYKLTKFLLVAFDKIGSMTTYTITKQRKKQEPAVMAALGQRLRRHNSMNVYDADDK